jgi:hypothetical protein
VLQGAFTCPGRNEKEEWMRESVVNVPEIVTVRLPEPVLKQVEALTGGQPRSRSAVLRKLIKTALEHEQQDR